MTRSTLPACCLRPIGFFFASGLGAITALGCPEVFLEVGRLGRWLHSSGFSILVRPMFATLRIARECAVGLPRVGSTLHMRLIRTTNPWPSGPLSEPCVFTRSEFRRVEVLSFKRCRAY